MIHRGASDLEDKTGAHHNGNAARERETGRRSRRLKRRPPAETRCQE